MLIGMLVGGLTGLFLESPQDAPMFADVLNTMYIGAAGGGIGFLCGYLLKTKHIYRFAPAKKNKIN